MVFIRDWQLRPVDGKDFLGNSVHKLEPEGLLRTKMTDNKLHLPFFFTPLGLKNLFPFLITWTLANNPVQEIFLVLNSNKIQLNNYNNKQCQLKYIVVQNLRCRQNTADLGQGMNVCNVGMGQPWCNISGLLRLILQNLLIEIEKVVIDLDPVLDPVLVVENPNPGLNAKKDQALVVKDQARVDDKLISGLEKKLKRFAKKVDVNK